MTRRCGEASAETRTYLNFPGVTVRWTRTLFVPALLMRARTPHPLTSPGRTTMPRCAMTTRAAPSAGLGSVASTSLSFTAPPVKSTTTRTKAGRAPMRTSDAARAAGEVHGDAHEGGLGADAHIRRRQRRRRRSGMGRCEHDRERRKAKQDHAHVNAQSRSS